MQWIYTRSSKPLALQSCCHIHRRELYRMWLSGKTRPIHATLLKRFTQDACALLVLVHGVGYICWNTFLCQAVRQWPMQRFTWTARMGTSECLQWHTRLDFSVPSGCMTPLSLAVLSPGMKSRCRFVFILMSIRIVSLTIKFSNLCTHNITNYSRYPWGHSKSRKRSAVMCNSRQ